MLQPADDQLHFDFANYYRIRSHYVSRLPLPILWTDLARFSIIGNVNSMNCVRWTVKNTGDVASNPLYEAKVTV